ncbi:hypothetical protein ACLOJK_041121, partial [Asimina triloba]
MDLFAQEDFMADLEGAVPGRQQRISFSCHVCESLRGRCGNAGYGQRLSPIPTLR